MRYYIISGEASGDLHGSNLIKELRLLDTAADFRCWGGDKMQAAGSILVKHYRDLAFMGFTEVIKNLPTILSNIKFCKQDVLAHKPDVLILIDYPGFNLRIAKWAKQQGFKVVYYISPQVWAWKESRVKEIKKSVDKMFVILPFEKDFYKKWNYEVEYVGHPLVKVIDDFKSSASRDDSSENIIAVLPGSRKQEISVKLPIMLEVAKSFPDYHFVVAKAPGIDDFFYETFLSPYKNVSTVENRTYELLSKARAAIVTSGTATLETALFGVPEVICYKGGKISYQIAKRLIKIKYICLVNLIMDKEVVKELIQDDLTAENIAHELNHIMYDSFKQEQLNNDYHELKKLLSIGGNASANAAKSIYGFLTNASIA
ncbi:lipid-A-disaccharide synthase [Ferruginibacter sp. SUN002]|uniref:lipid-A-disaccharide synthase n=1 Tax=Ferruginibacter sp. SUN002 TaxID=2937789 RepID=UPI003D36B060